MGSRSPASVISLQGPGHFRAYNAGEVLSGEFEGNPIVSIFDPVGRRGGAAKFKANHLQIDFKRWLETVQREFGSSFAGLQIKFLSAHRDVEAIRSLCNGHGLVPQAVAGFEENARLEVLFFTDSGRLRVAPMAALFREASKEYNRSVEKVKRKIRVLIVDDSKTMRTLLRNILSSCGELEVVGEAERPSDVAPLLAKLAPDVLTLDINMPEISGVELLRKILAVRFIPAVMISSLNIDEGKEVLDALEIGAVDYIHKPAAHEIAAMTPIIHEKIVNAAQVVRQVDLSEILDHPPVSVAKPSADELRDFSATGLVAIGASTGGTEAIKKIFTQLPREIPPIIVVQHIPPYFSTAFANRLNEICRFPVREAKDGEEIRPGVALVAPGGLHMEVKGERGRLLVRLFDAEPVNRFKPAVDVLFASVAQAVGPKATGVLLTGMGSDGAKGLLMMRQAGAFTVVQDQESSVVYGMPRAAVEIGAAWKICPLDEIPSTLMTLRSAPVKKEAV